MVVAGNMVRRVLHIIRDESIQLLAEEAEEEEEEEEEEIEDSKHKATYKPLHKLQTSLSARSPEASLMKTPSLHNLLEFSVGNQGFDGEDPSQKKKRNKTFQYRLKHNVIEAVNELIDELDSIKTTIAEQAIEHIHANEVVLTLGYSELVLTFLKEAGKKRQFSVFVAESAPKYQGHKLASQLSQAGIKTTVISDAAVFAMMARVNIVLVGAFAVMANGGIIGCAGTQFVSLAASKHSVPFVVLSGLHKLSPRFPNDPATFLSEIENPGEILDADALTDLDKGGSLQVVNSAFDYVPPEQVSMFITESGGHNPSYVYRLLTELYNPADYVL